MSRLIEKIWWCRMARIVRQKPYANSTTDGREVKCWSQNHLWLCSYHGRDPEGNKMGTTSAERQADEKVKNGVRSFAFSTWKKDFFTSDHYWRRKVDKFWEPKTQKIIGGPGQQSTSTIGQNGFGKEKMLCIWWDQKGVLYHKLLKPGETVNTVWYRHKWSIWTMHWSTSVGRDIIIFITEDGLIFYHVIKGKN